MWRRHVGRRATELREPFSGSTLGGVGGLDDCATVVGDSPLLLGSLGEVPTELGGDDTTVKKSHPRDPPPVSANVRMGSPQTEAEREAQRLLLDKVILELSVLDLDESRGRR